MSTAKKAGNPIGGLITRGHAALTWRPHKLAFIFLISRMPAKCCNIRGASGTLRTPTQGGKLILPQIALQQRWFIQYVISCCRLHMLVF